MVEQGTHKPLVVGSNPTLATDFFLGIKKLTCDLQVSFFMISLYDKITKRNPNQFWHFHPSWMDPKARN